MLNDLAPEDREACRDGVEVVVDVTGETFSEDGRGPEELRVTGVGVRLAGERERWVLIHHFLWTEDPGFYGTESVQLWPVYRDIPEGWIKAGEVTGRVLYSRDGREYAAPYFSLGEQTFTSDSVFWGEQQSTDIFAAFSFPADGGRQRGYLAYPVAELQDGYLISSWVNYTHQRSWLQYPVVTAMEKRMTSAWNRAGVFLTVQDALQFHPLEEEVELFG